MAGNAFSFTFTIGAIDRASAVIGSMVNASAAKLGTLQRSIAATSTAMKAMGTTSIMAGAALGGAMAVPVKQAMAFEHAMVGLGKQAGVTRDALGNMTPAGAKVMGKLTNEVFSLAKTIPMTTEQIAGMMEMGAKMGRPASQLADFTRQAAAMAAAFDADPIEIAEKFGKLGGVLGNLPANQLRELGDTINYLDDQSNASGAGIIEVMTRIGGTTRTLNMANKSAAALAATFLDLGKAPETAATASAALLTKLATAPEGAKRFQAGIKALGLNPFSLNKIMTKTPEAGLLMVLDKLNQKKSNQQIIIGTQLFGSEFADEAALLAKNVARYRELIALAKSNAAVGSMQREFNARLTERQNQLTLIGNKFQIIGIKIGTALLPELDKLLKFANPIVDRMEKWVNQNPKLVTQLAKAAIVTAALLVGLGGFLVVLGTLGGAIATGIGFLVKFVGFLMTAGRWALTLGRWIMLAVRIFFVFGRIAFVLNPVGMAINLIVLAAALLIANWSRVAPFFAALWAKIRAGFSALATGFKNDMAIWLEAGKNIVDTLAKGIMGGIGKIKTAMGKVTTAARAFLPFSPAKEGAFRDLHRVRVIETIAGAMRPAPMVRAMAAATAATATAMAIPQPAAAVAAPLAPSGGRGGAAVDARMYVTIDGASPAAREDFARMLEQHKATIARLVDSEKARRKERELR